MVDRKRRDELIEIIERFLDERTTAFEELGDELFELLGSTKDAAVSDVAEAMVYFCDDVDNQQVRLNKAEWDYIQRLLLLLKSDCRMETTRHRRWSWRQAAAACAVVLLAWLAWQLGWGMQLAALPLAAFPLSVLLRRCDKFAIVEPPEPENSVFPFDSTAQILAVRRRLPDFRKRRFPPRVAREPSNRLKEIWATAQMYAAWLVYSPVVLLLQMLPTTAVETRVVQP